MRRALMLLAMAWLVAAEAANLLPDVRCCRDCGSVCPCRLLDGCKCDRPQAVRVAPLDFPMPSPGS